MQEYCQEYKDTYYNKIRKILFPYALRPILEDDKRTYLTTTINLHVDWLDRIRLLITGRAIIQVITYTDVLVNEAQSVSSFHVEG